MQTKTGVGIRLMGGEIDYVNWIGKAQDTVPVTDFGQALWSSSSTFTLGSIKCNYSLTDTAEPISSKMI